MEYITNVYLSFVGYDFSIEQLMLNFEQDCLKETEVYYDYVDGEEGDTSKYEYYHGENLVGYIENLGGDEYKGELTSYGKQILFEQHMKACKKLLDLQ